MGSGSSKRSSPKTGSGKSSKVAIETKKTDTCSVPTQISDTSDIFKNGTDATNTTEKQNLDSGDQLDVFLTEVPQPWIDILNEVADTDLWSGIKRSERPEWRENLTKAVELANLPRTELAFGTKMAVYNGEPLVPELPDLRKKVLVFVSSTFTDTKAERNQLMKDVYPYIRDVCKRLGLEFGTIDMRWGVTDEATKEHSTVKMCVEEIERCIQESCGPAFLCILGHKYGYRPIPATIEESEFEKILAYLINNGQDTALLKAFYRLDKNADGNEYALRSMRNDEDKSQWWDDIEIIQRQIREAVLECYNKNPKVCDKYFVSVTETEIQTGAFSNSKKDSQSCFMIRELGDIQNKFHHHRKLRDMKGSEVDEDANDRLNTLIQKKLSGHIRKENICMLDYKSVNVQGASQSVREFCDKVCQKLIDMIFENYKTKCYVNSDSDFIEVMQHLTLAVEKRTLFVGRKKELKEVKNYLSSKTHASKPLVVFGTSGSGKTSLMAVAAEHAKKMFKNSVVVVRFIGTTSQSGTVRNLLFSVCKQIANAYVQDVTLIPDSTRELASYFRTAICQATKTSPLIIILDSLDQLSADDSGRKLEWLKLDEDLPKHVKIVLSSLDADTLPVLQKHLPQKNFVHVMKLLPGEGPEILNKMLKLKGRRITESQMKVVMDAFLQTPLPLYLSLAADAASKWRSYYTVQTDDISPTVKGMIELLFERLEKKFGNIFIRHGLAYITASKHGLSQGELEDILSCDDEVLDSLFQYWTPPMRRMPPLLWTRVRHELGSYLAERGSDGVTVYTWFHRQFNETARERYLNTSDGTDMSSVAHIAIADYFDGKWADGKHYVPKCVPSAKTASPILEDRGLQRQPFSYGDDVKHITNVNKRKLRELPYHLLKSGYIERFTKLALDLEYISMKFEAEMGHDYFSELAEGAKISGADNLIKMVRFIGANLSFLLREPMAIYQLASQQSEHHPAKEQLKQLQGVPVCLMTNTTYTDDPDLETCELTLQGHKKSPICCDISPKGDRIVSTSVDGCLRIWDVLTGSEVAVISTLPVSEDPDGARPEMKIFVQAASPCCFSRDGESIAVGSNEGGVVIYDYDGTNLRCEATENNAVSCIQFSPDNTSLVTGFINGNIYVWDARSLEHRGTLQFEHEVLDIDFSPDGDMLAVVCHTGLSRVAMNPLAIDWFAKNIAVKNQMIMSRRARRPDVVLCCSYHPNGTRIMTGAADNNIGIWDSSNGACINKLGDHAAWIWSIKITKDGSYMFSSSSDRSIKLWKSSSPDQWDVVTTLYGHSHRVDCLALDHVKEARLVSASLDCTLKVWDTGAVKKLKSESSPKESNLHFNTLAISPSVLQIAKSNGWSRYCEIQNTDSQDESGCIQTDSQKGFIKKSEFTFDGGKLVVLDHGHLGDYLPNSALKAKCVVYYSTDGKKLQELDVSSGGIDGPTAFSCSRSYIVVGTLLGSIWLFDLNTYEFVTRWKWEPNISTASCSLVDELVVSAAGVNSSLWKISGNEQKLLSELPVHDSNIVTSAFSPDGLSFAIGVESGKVYIWNISDSSVKLDHTLTGHTAPIKDINFSKPGDFMVTCADLSARVWDMKNNCVLKSVYFAPVNCVVFKSERKILAGDATGNLNCLCF